MYIWSCVLPFGVCADGSVVRIWDIKGPSYNIHNFEGHAGPVTAVAFSENGCVDTCEPG